MAERLPTYLQARFAAIGNQLEQNEWLSSELDTIDESIESTRRELRVQHNELMKVLRDITMEALMSRSSSPATAELPCVKLEMLVRADSACANPNNRKEAELKIGGTSSTNSLRASGAAYQPDPETTSARHSKSTAARKAPVTIKRLRETVKPPFFRPNGVSMY
ncbi:hypothetical protein LTR10_003031 [Elasticomyces elasticus]|nr:hypothetical protein LTR10_003031 [Elasticomyces elasticus]KAK4967631.1 hypothetical protein LTR42_009956 [Elasticomyces elasticus]